MKCHLVHVQPLRSESFLQDHVVGQFIINTQDEDIPMDLTVCQLEAAKACCPMEQGAGSTNCPGTALSGSVALADEKCARVCTSKQQQHAPSTDGQRHESLLQIQLADASLNVGPISTRNEFCKLSSVSKAFFQQMRSSSQVKQQSLGQQWHTKGSSLQ